jgi:hypothetical protein
MLKLCQPKLKSVLTFMGATAGAAGIWSTVAPAASAHWASYAYSATGDYGFVSYQHLTRTEAEQAALKGCSTGTANKPNADCRILVSGSRWIAVTQTENQLFWFQESAQKLAQDGAMRLCRKRQEVEPAQPCALRMLAHASGGILLSPFRPKEVLPPEVLNPKPADVKPNDPKPPEPKPLEAKPTEPAPSNK